jgi:hypothetical protein
MAIKDKLGNIIKVGQLINATITEHSIVCEVVEIQEPSMLSTSKDAMQVPGVLVLTSRHMIPIMPDPRLWTMTALVVAQTPPELKDGKPN